MQLRVHTWTTCKVWMPHDLDEKYCCANVRPGTIAEDYASYSNNEHRCREREADDDCKPIREYIDPTCVRECFDENELGQCKREQSVWKTSQCTRKDWECRFKREDDRWQFR